MTLATSDLDAFVAESDRLGGPGAPACQQYWSAIEYRPDMAVDQSLDPFSEAYVEQQLELYREMSGRDFDQLSNEHTTLDVDLHAAAVNPYNHGSPGELALHMERLTRAFRLGAPPRGSEFLDMGCGWGLSSEVGAYCGLHVTAIDVNPDFVTLVNRRAERFGHAITASQATFDTFESDQRFAMILFYECFHHALRPWDLLTRMAGHLTPDGKLVLAGEPINDYWWKHWGMRLDPLSVYCIRKFGWLESGWSADFLMSAFQRAGLNVRIHEHADSAIGPTVVGSRSKIGNVAARDVGTSWQNSGWLLDGEYMICLDNSSLMIASPEKAASVSICFRNFRAKPVRLSIRNNRKIVYEGELSPGDSHIELDRQEANGILHFNGETWVPDMEIHNGDKRQISLHLESVTFF